MRQCFFKGPGKLFVVHEDVWTGFKTRVGACVNSVELEKLLSSVPWHCFTGRPQYWHYVKILSQRGSLCKVSVRCCPVADTGMSRHLSTTQYTKKNPTQHKWNLHMHACLASESNFTVLAEMLGRWLCPMLPPIPRQEFALHTHVISQWIVQVKDLIHKDT